MKIKILNPKKLLIISGAIIVILGLGLGLGFGIKSNNNNNPTTPDLPISQQLSFSEQSVNSHEVLAKSINTTDLKNYAYFDYISANEQTSAISLTNTQAITVSFNFIANQNNKILTYANGSITDYDYTFYLPINITNNTNQIFYAKVVQLQAGSQTYLAINSLGYFSGTPDGLNFVSYFNARSLNNDSITTDFLVTNGNRNPKTASPIELFNFYLVSSGTVTLEANLYDNTTRNNLAYTSATNASTFTFTNNDQNSETCSFLTGSQNTVKIDDLDETDFFVPISSSNNLDYAQFTVLNSKIALISLGRFQNSIYQAIFFTTDLNNELTNFALSFVKKSN